jgi:hypothetical protein
MRVGPRLAVVWLCAWMAVSVAYAAAEQKFGKQLLIAYELPPEQIVAFQQLKPKARDPNASVIDNLLAGDSVSWRGPEQPCIKANNPYTLVIRLKGKAIDAGAASSLWLAGWQYVDSNGAETGRQNPVTGLSEPKAAAGQQLSLVSGAGPVSVSDDRLMTPVISLQRAENLQIDAVTVEIWTGLAPTGAAQLFLSLQWLWIGLAMLGVWWFWVRR